MSREREAIAAREQAAGMQDAVADKLEQAVLAARDSDRLQRLRQDADNARGRAGAARGRADGAQQRLADEGVDLSP